MEPAHSRFRWCDHRYCVPDILTNAWMGASIMHLTAQPQFGGFCRERTFAVKAVSDQIWVGTCLSGALSAFG